MNKVFGLFSRCMAAVLMAPLLIAAAPAAQTIAIDRGRESYLYFDHPLRRVTAGEAGIVTVSVLDGSTLRILGTGFGHTTLHIWQANATMPKEYDVTVAMNLSPLRQRLAADPNFAGIHVEFAGGKIVLEGVFNDAGSQKQARALIEAVTGAEILDLSELASDAIVQVDVRVVAVSKTALSGLGFNFQKLSNDFSIVAAAPNSLQSLSLNPGGAPVVSAPIASAFNLLLGSPKFDALGIISALESSQYAETIANPTLVVHSGEKAEFLAGGEVPIPVPQGAATNAITIEYKRFGVSLNIEPTLLKDGRISMKIRPEVSELDYSNAVAMQGFSVPAIRTRQTETTVVIKDNEPLILAGLTYLTRDSGTESVPYLHDIPILGKLLERRRETSEEQELLVAVVPHLFKPGTQPLLRAPRARDLLDTSSALGFSQ
jgi:pilus assembly protein CpaC